MAAPDPRSRLPSFWLVQVAGWLAYGLIGALGALQYRDRFPVVLYFLGTTCAAFLASFVMLALCRRLTSGRRSWLGVAILILGVSFGLGTLCSTTGAALEAMAVHGLTKLPWRSVAMVGFANALSPTIVLVAWSAIYWTVQHWRDGQQRERQLLLVESLAREAELKALRYQITPHFLFNTLNGISTLVGEGRAQAARDMIALLARFLRSTLEPTRQGDVTLAQELTQVQQYIEIEQIRLSQRLVVSIHCDLDIRNALVPHLLLQPLVENAIRHGISPHAQGGALALHATGENGRVHLSIVNTMLAGAEPTVVQNGVGLSNTAARLAARYGEDHAFNVSGNAQDGWRVAIRIPLQLAPEASS